MSDWASGWIVTFDHFCFHCDHCHFHHFLHRHRYHLRVLCCFHCSHCYHLYPRHRFLLRQPFLFLFLKRMKITTEIGMIRLVYKMVCAYVMYTFVCFGVVFVISIVVTACIVFIIICIWRILATFISSII